MEKGPGFCLKGPGLALLDQSLESLDVHGPNDTLRCFDGPLLPFLTGSLSRSVILRSFVRSFVRSFYFVLLLVFPS